MGSEWWDEWWPGLRPHGPGFEPSRSGLAPPAGILSVIWSRGGLADTEPGPSGCGYFCLLVPRLFYRTIGQAIGNYLGPLSSGRNGHEHSPSQSIATLQTMHSRPHDLRVPSVMPLVGLHMNHVDRQRLR